MLGSDALALNSVALTNQVFLCNYQRVKGSRVKASAHLVLDVHLVKLVDAADPVICQHQRSRLNAKLARLGLLCHAGCQTRRRTGLAGSVDGAGQETRHVPKKKRLLLGS
jgi:hypothetical protein